MRCCWVCGGILGWRASYQGLGLAWILSGSLVDGTAFNTLFSRMLLGQGSALPTVFTVGLQIVGVLPRCAGKHGSFQVPGRAPVRTLNLSLDRQDWLWTIAERGWN